MIKNSIFKILFFAITALFIISCDSDYNELGSDIIEDDIHHNGIVKYESEVIAYQKKLGPVQVNNLPLNSLGVYTNPVFGKTVAHFATQVQLATVNPVFRSDAVIDSVYLYVPYFSKLVNTDSEGTSTYTLDSIYGNRDAKFDLKVYRNGYFIRSVDPSTENATGQKYFSDEMAPLDAVKGIQLNTATDVSQNTGFYFKNTEVQRKYVKDGAEKVAERFAPGIFMYLDVNVFKEAILDAPEGKLVNNNVFAEYFRGLYFKAEQIGSDGAMAKIRFNQGKIVVRYSEPKLGTDGNPLPSGEKVRKTVTLNLTGNTINFLDTTTTPGYDSALALSNSVTGDDRLYVNGGSGSMSVIELNKAEIRNQLKGVNGDPVIVNEANLVFYLDDSKYVNNSADNDPAKLRRRPLRVYLYDLDNRRQLYDYSLDGTSNSSDNKYDKFIFGGIGQKTGTQTRYKVRLTNHINNLVSKDSTNIRLGVVVSESINLTANAALKTPITIGTQTLKSVPLSSVITSDGAVFYGNNPAAADNDKRLRLEIFYTKPN